MTLISSTNKTDCRNIVESGAKNHNRNPNPFNVHLVMVTRSSKFKCCLYINNNFIMSNSSHIFHYLTLTVCIANTVTLISSTNKTDCRNIVESGAKHHNRNPNPFNVHLVMVTRSSKFKCCLYINNNFIMSNSSHIFHYLTLTVCIANTVTLISSTNKTDCRNIVESGAKHHNRNPNPFNVHLVMVTRSSKFKCCLYINNNFIMSNSSHIFHYLTLTVCIANT